MLPKTARPEGHALEVETIREDVVTAPGATDRSDRARVMAGEAPRDIAEFLEIVRHSSHRMTDEHIAALRRAGLTEDEVYELTVAAAVGVASDRLDAALRALAAS